MERHFPPFEERGENEWKIPFSELRILGVLEQFLINFRTYEFRIKI
jgi:hypothetical protein